MKKPPKKSPIFAILLSKVQCSVFRRFGRFDVQFSGANWRFGRFKVWFLEVRKFQGLVFSGSTQH